MTQGFFGNIGLPPERYPNWPFGGNRGIALLVGLVTRIASILFIIEMIGSSIVAKLQKAL